MGEWQVSLCLPMDGTSRCGKSLTTGVMHQCHSSQAGVLGSILVSDENGCFWMTKRWAWVSVSVGKRSVQTEDSAKPRFRCTMLNVPWLSKV